jgi:tocopherol O-methyltransferase
MSEQTNAVVRYYIASHKAYSRAWSGKEDQSIHFGYYDSPEMTHSQAMVRMNEVLANLVNIGPEDRVVDAGCGYGGSAVWLARHRGCHVQGVNITPHQVEIGNEHAKKFNVADKVDILLADFAKTGLESTSFDVYWALEATLHSEDRHVTLAEAYRLLKPGGRLVVVEYFVPLSIKLPHEVIEGYQTLLSGWAMPSLWTEKRFVQLLEDVGFSDVKSKDIRKNIVPSVERVNKIVKAFLPVTRFLVWLGIYDVDRVRHSEATHHFANAILDEKLEYIAITARKPTA